MIWGSNKQLVTLLGLQLLSCLQSYGLWVWFRLTLILVMSWLQLFILLRDRLHGRVDSQIRGGLDALFNEDLLLFLQLSNDPGVMQAIESALPLSSLVFGKQIYAHS
jgi:hypothetical protein